MRLFRNGGANIKLATYEFSAFTCLGTLVTNNNDLRPEVERRLLPPNRAYYALAPVLKSHAVHRV